MAIIYKYPYDIVVQDKDAWIGTEASNKQTKQYTAEAIADYLNKKGKVSVAGQLAYRFNDEPYETTGSFALPEGSGDDSLFLDITKIIIYNRDIANQYVVPYINYLVGEEILISSQKNVSSFGHYKIGSFIQNDEFPNYYILDLIHIGSNGVLNIDNIYDIVNFTFGVEGENSVDTIDTTDGNYINLTPTGESIGDVVISADLSAIDGNSNFETKFLTKDNKWATISQQESGSIILTNGVDLDGETTFTVDVTSLIRTGILAKNCKAEVVTEVGRQTVYTSVTGNG